MNHTPTPWELEERDGGGYKLTDADCEFVSFVCQSRYPDGREDEEAEANAAFIVRACNAHDELVAALADSTAAITTLLETRAYAEWAPAKKAAIAAADAALARATLAQVQPQAKAAA